MYSLSVSHEQHTSEVKTILNLYLPEHKLWHNSITHSEKRLQDISQVRKNMPWISQEIKQKQENWKTTAATLQNKFVEQQNFLT